MTPSPLRELYLARLREFYRQPARIFWVYGFPTCLAVVLGLAFQSRPTPLIDVDVLDDGQTRPLQEALLRSQSLPRAPGQPQINAHYVNAEVGRRRIKTGKSALFVSLSDYDSRGEFGSTPKPLDPPLPFAIPNLAYVYDPTRPEAVAARGAFDDTLQRALGRKDRIEGADRLITERGSRYIDFLIPGLIGVNTMGGGLWGIGFLIVNFRISKLLKRFVATPMPRRDFLLAILGARLTFLIPDVFVLLALGAWGFGMPVRGSLAVLALVEIAGALAFAGIGLLVACRAATTETVSGLMNLVMIPMWLFSGVFFASDRFPTWLQPFIKALPLTQLVEGLRKVILEGAGVVDVAVPLAVLLAWALGTFALALRLFRWS